MAARTYRVLLYDIRTQKVYADIETSAIGYDYELDAEGSASVSFPLDTIKLDGKKLKPYDVFPVRTGVAIQRGSELVWGGLLWQYKVDLSSKFITLDAGGYLSYYKYRHTYTWGNRFKNKETVDIIKKFILDINGNNGINTNLTGLHPVMNKVTKVWAPFEYTSIADVITDMSDEVAALFPGHTIYGSGGGFFFYFDPYFVDPTRVGNRMTNTTDRVPDFNGITLKQSVNCEFGNISVDGNSLANMSYAVGAAGKATAQTPHYELRSRSFSSLLPYLDTILSDTDEKNARNLYWKCRSALSAGSTPIIIPTATTYPNKFSPKQFKPGDLIKVTTDDDFLELEDAEYVITKVSVDVGSDGSDRITLEMIPVELFKDVDTSDA